MSADNAIFRQECSGRRWLDFDDSDTEQFWGTVLCGQQYTPQSPSDTQCPVNSPERQRNRAFHGGKKDACLTWKLPLVIAKWLLIWTKNTHCNPTCRSIVVSSEWYNGQTFNMIIPTYKWSMKVFPSHWMLPVPFSPTCHTESHILKLKKLKKSFLILFQTKKNIREQVRRFGASSLSDAWNNTTPKRNGVHEAVVDNWTGKKEWDFGAAGSALDWRSTGPWFKSEKSHNFLFLKSHP